MQPDEPASDIDQEIRINELREATREAVGEEMTSWEAEDLPPDLAEGFWQNVLAYETAEMTTHFQQLEERGVKLPPPDELDDTALTVKLGEMIESLAAIDVYLSQTDHLSDRELYTVLWQDLLREEGPAFPPGSGWNCHLDILGGCSEEDLYLQRMYYDDEEQRARWHADFPDDPMPPHVDPPYDRDSKLPKPNRD